MDDHLSGTRPKKHRVDENREGEGDLLRDQVQT